MSCIACSASFSKALRSVGVVPWLGSLKIFDEGFCKCLRSFGWINPKTFELTGFWKFLLRNLLRLILRFSRMNFSISDSAWLMSLGPDFFLPGDIEPLDLLVASSFCLLETSSAIFRQYLQLLALQRFKSTTRSMLSFSFSS